MRNMRSLRPVLLVFSLAVTLPSAVAQVVIATIPVEKTPRNVAVNTATNKIYVTNSFCNGNFPCASAGTVTVIDGATNSTATVNVGVYPYRSAVDPVTNKIYVANACGNDLTCNSAGTVTVIDGMTNNAATVNVGAYPYAVAVNAMTNQIYVANACGNDLTCNSAGTVTVIDGTTNNTTTVNVEDSPVPIAVDAVTNKIYVANACGNDLTCNSAGTVTVIDGATNNVVNTVTVGFTPDDVAINSVTNQIYVTNECGNDVNCQSLGTVTVIDGVGNGTTTVNVGAFPQHVAVDSVTNEMYVSNNCGNDLTCNSAGTVTVIDGATNNTTNVNVGVVPYGVGVDSVTNKIYVANFCGNDLNCASAGTVTVIDGATNSTVPVAVGDAPVLLGLNETTDRIYVPNRHDGTVAVIAGDTALQFVAATPCRVVDTRNPDGTFGGPTIQGGTFRSFPIPQGACNIPTTASAYSLNVTLVPYQGMPVGYLTIWPQGENQPVASTTNSLDGRVKANAAILPGGVSGGVNVFVSNTADAVLDIDGYFTLANNSTLAFYPLTPCRVADTRNNNYPPGLGPPSLSGGVPRDFPILSSDCQIPNTAQAYSFNFTAVPPGPLGYLTVWPAGQNQPVVSTLNDVTGTVVANAAIVPAGTGGDIDAFASNNTDLVIDINGYFAPPGQGGLSLYPMAPCRVLDTRNGNGAFVGELTVDVVDSVCGPSNLAQAYVFNATVVPPGPLGYLTLWPDGGNQPGVSTLNAIDGAVTSNMAIVPTTNGSIDAFASNLTQLVLDISAYFAP